MPRITHGLLILIGTLIVSTGIVTAQVAQCRDDVINILEQIGEYCREVGRNEACYGNRLVEAEFHADSPSLFDEPADRASINQIAQLRLSGWSDEAQEWGVVLLQVQADLPEVLPGQNVKVLLMGDLALGNTVAPDDAISTAASATTITRNRSVLRAGPGMSFAAMDAVEADTEISVYATDPSGEWLRLTESSAPRWIRRSRVEDNEMLDTLPALDAGSYTPMQAIRLETGISQPACREAPDSMLIQSPADSEVEMVINGREVRIGSTVVFTYEDDNTLKLAVLDGSAQVGGIISVPTGQAIQIDTDSNGIPTGEWYGLHPMVPGELADYAIYEQIPASLLHYRITLPEAQPLQDTSPADNNTEADDSDASSRMTPPPPPANTGGSDTDSSTSGGSSGGGSTGSGSTDSDSGEGGESEED